jgi:hypothetical protein
MSESTNVTPRYLTLLDTSTYLSIPVATLRTRLCRGGAPPAIRVGRRVYFDRHDLDAFMSRRKGDAEAGR